MKRGPSFFYAAISRSTASAAMRTPAAERVRVYLLSTAGTESPPAFLTTQKKGSLKAETERVQAAILSMSGICPIAVA